MEIFTVTAKNTPRMDSFLLEKLPALSIGKLNKYLRENKIKLNGKKQPLATRLKQGDEIRLYLPIENADEAKAPTKNALSIVYEDDALLLVQKPAGLLC
ncbi:MAG: RluA family pseudouridine synthase, partial [Oscillospiraceae bacterium]|nr:RluA family pseudouridine synthase [Oscillospiraceae bacterium]